MSLQELSGSTIHLRLSIREGHGFGFLKSPIVIVAGTNGIFLETEVVPPSPDPLFHIDLVWETDKKNLRRFRASNTPIKLECFTVDVANQRTCIGSILLNIKSAQVIVTSALKNVNEKWHRLIGVPPEAKALQPELLLSLTIQSPNSLSKPLAGEDWNGKAPADPGLSTRKSDTPNFSNAQKITHPLSTLSVLVPECKKGYIQLGAENSCIDTFLVHLCAKRLQEIELLLLNNQENVRPSDIAQPFQISFTIFGQNLKTKYFGNTNAENVCLIDEEVVVPIRTSLPVLHHFLQESPCVVVSLLSSGKEMAASELHIRSLVPTNDIQAFSREFNGEALLSQKCILVSSISGTVPFQDNLQPYIDVVTRLELVSDLTSFQKIPPLNSSRGISYCSSHSPVVTGQLVEDTPSRSDSRHSQDTFIVTTQSGPVWVPVAPGTAQSHLITRTKHVVKDSATTASIKIVPNQLEFFQLPKASCVRFLFECPSSSAVTSQDLLIPNGKGPVLVDGISAEILVQPTDSIQIHIFGVGVESSHSPYIASTNINIKTIILAEKGEIRVSSDLRGPLSDQKVGLLLATISLGQIYKGTGKEVKGNVIEPESKLPLCKALPNSTDFCGTEAAFERSSSTKKLELPLTINSNEIKMTESPSENRQPAFNLKPLLYENDHQNITQTLLSQAKGPAVSLDNTAAYKIVEELEDWKEKQQEIFLAELKRKEVEHITRITDECTAQSKAQSLTIENKMADCKEMIESLAKAKQDLRDRLKTCATREQAFTKAKEDLELQYNLKFQEFTLAAKRLDEGFKLKVALVESKCSKLDERIKELESENENLRQQLKQKIRAHQSDGQMCGMSHNQVSQLLSQVDQLEGKLHSSLQSKAYFKEQWGRAVREMNQAKLQYAQTPENNKCFEKILGKEEKELHNDQRTLEMLRREISQLNS